MRHILLFALVFLVGCQGQSNGARLDEPNATEVESPSSDGPRFELTPSAVARVTLAKVVSKGTHLVVSVDFDDEKYCTGVHYNLAIENNPSMATHLLTESNGIALAIERDDLEFLRGTKLDWVTLPSGTEGFVFLNPQDKESMTAEARDHYAKQAEQDSKSPTR